MLYNHAVYFEMVNDAPPATLRGIVLEVDAETGAKSVADIIEFNLTLGETGERYTKLVLNDYLCRRFPDLVIDERYNDIDLGRARRMDSKLLKIVKAVANA